MTNAETKRQAPYCPKCKSKGLFRVGIPQRNFYAWDGEEWIPTDAEPQFEGMLYDVTCDNCMWNWQAEPWD